VYWIRPIQYVAAVQAADQPGGAPVVVHESVDVRGKFQSQDRSEVQFRPDGRVRHHHHTLS
jgi:hypothetical protein